MVQVTGSSFPLQMFTLLFTGSPLNVSGVSSNAAREESSLFFESRAYGLVFLALFD